MIQINHTFEHREVGALRARDKRRQIHSRPCAHHREKRWRGSAHQRCERRRFQHFSRSRARGSRCARGRAPGAGGAGLEPPRPGQALPAPGTPAELRYPHRGHHPRHPHTPQTPTPRPAPAPVVAWAFSGALWPPIPAGVSRRAQLSPNCGRSSLSLRRGGGHDPSRAGTWARAGQIPGRGQGAPSAPPRHRDPRPAAREVGSGAGSPHPSPPPQDTAAPAAAGRPRVAEQQRQTPTRRASQSSQS